MLCLLLPTAIVEHVHHTQHLSELRTFVRPAALELYAVDTVRTTYSQNTSTTRVVSVVHA
jgi:hypothetical protein